MARGAITRTRAVEAEKLRGFTHFSADIRKSNSYTLAKSRRESLEAKLSLEPRVEDQVENIGADVAGHWDFRNC